MDSSGSGVANNNRQSLSSLQVEVIEVKNTDLSVPLFVHLRLGDQRLRANVKGKNERPEAVVFTQKKLADLYKENLVFTLANKENNTVIGQNSLPVKKLMIGKKVQWEFGGKKLIVQCKHSMHIHSYTV